MNTYLKVANRTDGHDDVIIQLSEDYYKATFIYTRHNGGWRLNIGYTYDYIHERTLDFIRNFSRANYQILTEEEVMWEIL